MSQVFFSYLPTPLVVPRVSLQERRLESGVITGPVVLPLCFSFSFCTIFHVCFSMDLTLMQAPKINVVLLRNTSFLHVLLILSCFINVLLLWEANVEVFLSHENKKVRAGYSVDVIACSVWVIDTYLDMRFDRNINFVMLTCNKVSVLNKLK